MKNISLAEIAAATIAAATVLFLGSARAEAADMFNWSGFYLGANGGYARLQTTWFDPNDDFFTNNPGESFKTRAEGHLIGSHAGYNFQHDHLVMGVEGSFDAAGLRKKENGPLDFPQDSFDTKLNHLVSVTARLGYAEGNALLYAKGGWAGGDVRFTTTTSGDLDFSKSQWLNGWTAGAGFEVAASRNLSWGIEYNYTKLGEKTFSSDDPNNPGTFPDRNFAINSVLLRMSYLFDSH